MAKKKSKDSSGNSIRNTAVMAAAATGKKQSEIAADFGVSRETVNRILNSDEAKRLNDRARSAIQELQLRAVEVLDKAMDETRPDFNIVTATSAAVTILKGTGALTEKSEVLIMKPFIYEGPDGEQVVMGHKPHEEGE